MLRYMGKCVNSEVKVKARKGQTDCIHSVSVFSGDILVQFQATGRMHRISVPWMDALDRSSAIGLTSYKGSSGYTCRLNAALLATWAENVPKGGIVCTMVQPCGARMAMDIALTSHGRWRMNALGWGGVEEDVSETGALLPVCSWRCGWVGSHLPAQLQPVCCGCLVQLPRIVAALARN